MLRGRNEDVGYQIGFSFTIYSPWSGPGTLLRYPICKAICHSASASLKIRTEPEVDGLQELI